MSYLSINNLHKRFVTPGGREILALQGVSLEIEQGDILCIVGHNGSGKTTLLSCLRQNFPYDGGSILIDGSPLKTQKQNIVSVFQDIGLGVVGSMTALENLSLVFSREPGFMVGFPKHRFSGRIVAFLEEIGLRERFDSFGESPVSELSGGQRQQVAIVMAMMRRPDILLLDEFAANLDTNVKSTLLPWMHNWIFKNRITTLMVTHDTLLSETWGNWVLELSNGALVRFDKIQHGKEYKYA